jgi:hypothetical protein
MGMNIQGNEFWEMRPDNFSIMSRAFDKREEQRWLPFRRLMSVIVASQGGEVQEQDFIFLPSFDAIKEKPKAIIFTAEEIEAITKEHIINGSIKNKHE